MTIEQDAQLLADKEEWCRHAAGVICANHPKLEFQVALAAARWASMWIDDLKLLIEECEHGSLDELTALITAAKASSFERADGLNCYPSGAPSIRTYIAAQEAFELAFNGEEAYARRLLEQD